MRNKLKNMLRKTFQLLLKILSKQLLPKKWKFLDNLYQIFSKFKTITLKIKYLLFFLKGNLRVDKERNLGQFLLYMICLSLKLNLVVIVLAIRLNDI